MERDPTVFERRVYDLVCKVPAGKVVTYASMARELDCGLAQAIGQALKRNPYAPEVPCHRVIKTDLSIGGYGGKTDGVKLKRKLKLLRDEGVKFNGEGRLVTEQALYDFR